MLVFIFVLFLLFGAGFLLFGAGYIIVYIIDSLRGETKLVHTYKQDKLNQSIEAKIQSGVEFTKEEKAEIERRTDLAKLAYNLSINDIKTKDW